MSRTQADMLVELARELATEDEVDGVLRRLVAAAVSEIDGAERAGITMLDRAHVSTPVASDDLVVRIDQYQYAVGQGPCLSAAAGDESVVRADDLSMDGRWPDFAPAVVQMGVRSMLSFHLYTHRSTIGALNVYAQRPHAFSDDSLHTGRLLAAHAALAAASTVQQAHLRIALDTRDVIGQAKGVLMERFKISANQSFDLLVAASQRTGRKLYEVSRDLAETGELVTGAQQ